jgi:PIN domain nuclease of toxin-antitoxin system
MELSFLSEDVVNALSDAGNELWLSPISTWEVLILSEKGRIRLDAPPIEWMNNVFNMLPFFKAVLNHEVAIQSRKINLPHQDPADQFIAARQLFMD